MGRSKTGVQGGGGEWGLDEMDDVAVLVDWEVIVDSVGVEC